MGWCGSLGTLRPKWAPSWDPVIRQRRNLWDWFPKLCKLNWPQNFFILYNAPVPASLAKCHLLFSPTQVQFPWTCMLPPRIFILTFSLYVLEKSHSCTSEKPLGRGLQNDFGLEKLQTWVGLKIRCWLVPGTWVFYEALAKPDIHSRMHIIFTVKGLMQA